MIKKNSTTIQRPNIPWYGFIIYFTLYKHEKDKKIDTIRSMNKIDNSRLCENTQKIPRLLIERVHSELPLLPEPLLHPGLNLNSSYPGLSGRLSCTPPSKITVGVVWVIFRFCLACSHYHVNTTKTVIILMSVPGVEGWAW